MSVNRLTYYKSGRMPILPIEYDYLESGKDARTTFITIIQREVDNSKNKLSINWSNEIFNYITESLKEISDVKKIIINLAQKDVIRIWSVVQKEDKKTLDHIYEKELAILEYLANFDYDIDFHVITEDMAKDVIDKDSKVVFDSHKSK